MPYTYKYPRPCVTTDVVVFAVDAAALKILLIKRKDEPFKGSWALPGGFLKMQEDLLDGASRELLEETGVTPAHMEQLYTFGSPNRDPRARTITVAYLALVRVADHLPAAGSDAKEAEWFDVEQLPRLAFDHDEIIKTGRARLRVKVRYSPLGFDLLPAPFTLPELQRLYEIVVGRGLDRANFRKKMLGTGLLLPAGRTSVGKPTSLYEFNRDEYERLSRQGMNFEI
jgi:8-oxo-dGTP diphosphatase